MKTRKLLYILPLAALVACEPEFDDVDFNGGSADFTKTVAVGNSLTAGYQSGALSAEGQINSLPAILAEQLKEVGGGEFNQPLLTGEQGTKGIGVDPTLAVMGQVETRLALKGTVDCLGEASLGPVRKGDPYSAVPFLTGMASVAADGPYNNQGVPGARLVDITNPAFPNPFFARIKTSLPATMLSMAMDLDATFFTFWIGNNDVLGYATTGGDEGSTGPNGMTDPNTFTMSYDAAIDSLTANGAKGVVANIPDITSIPFFTTVKWNALVLTQAQADFFNNYPLVQAYNAALDNPSVIAQFGMNGAVEAESRKLNFSAGANGFLMLDTDLSDAVTDTMGTPLPKFRQLKSGELITLTVPGDDIKCKGLGSADLSDPQNPVINPMTGNYILDLDEIQKIQNNIAAYNSTIKMAAMSHSLAHVDANSRLNQLASTGITIDGITYSSALVTGGAFSLDGVHPNTRGYAILANDFIDAINSTYSANVPKVSVASFSTIEVEQ